MFVNVFAFSQCTPKSNEGKEVPSRVPRAPFFFFTHKGDHPVHFCVTTSVAVS